MLKRSNKKHLSTTDFLPKYVSAGASANAAVKKLWKAALKAQKFSYSPYSKYAVGAALEADNGIIFLGCNVENASYGGTMCAERVAFLKAVSSGVKSFKRIFVVVRAPARVGPCALCLQTMAEFCDPNFEIWIGHSKAITGSYRFSELLTLPFGPKQLRE